MWFSMHIWKLLLVNSINYISNYTLNVLGSMLHSVYIVCIYVYAHMNWQCIEGLRCVAMGDEFNFSSIEELQKIRTPLSFSLRHPLN